MIFSIVTPSYNQASYLAETIESVIGQAGDFHIDYIIVDGGSQDNSVEILKHYAKLLEEERWQIKCRGITFRWLSEKDQGQADALMKGFRLSAGDVLAWLNSDDTYLPGTLSKVAEAFALHPEISVVYGKAYYIDPAGKVIGRYPTGAFDLKRLAVFNYICQPSTFFRKSSFKDVGGLDVSLHFCMDYDLWIRLAKSSEFIYLQDFLATYRLHEESKTVSERSALANHEEALRVARKYFDWAPLSRVYVCCHGHISNTFPSFLKKLGFPIVFAALVFSVARYLYLNKGIRIDDLRSINFKNLGGISRTRMDRYRNP
jgi:glycosyltransferase involved in cell wall biosynthesis